MLLLSLPFSHFLFWLLAFFLLLLHSSLCVNSKLISPRNFPARCLRIFGVNFFNWPRPHSGSPSPPPLSLSLSLSLSLYQCATNLTFNGFRILLLFCFSYSHFEQHFCLVLLLLFLCWCCCCSSYGSWFLVVVVEVICNVVVIEFALWKSNVQLFQKKKQKQNEKKIWMGGKIEVISFSWLASLFVYLFVCLFICLSLCLFVYIDLRCLSDWLCCYCYCCCAVFTLVVVAVVCLFTCCCTFTFHF